MTYLEFIKEQLIQAVKNKSILDIAYEFKRTDEYKNRTMDEIVEMLESEVTE